MVDVDFAQFFESIEIDGAVVVVAFRRIAYRILVRPREFRVDVEAAFP
ncbi:MAG: hypothetical protein MZU79_02750 [Anaerotruncus sp.]|nr:hypothetical protein [Anaerotruncus sp.]